MRVVFYSVSNVIGANSKKIRRNAKYVDSIEFRTSRAFDFLMFMSPIDLEDAILLLQYTTV